MEFSIRDIGWYYFHENVAIQVVTGMLLGPHSIKPLVKLLVIGPVPLHCHLAQWLITFKKQKQHSVK
jgi:hypothetical protein